MKSKPSPATIISCVALFFSLAGTGIAAQHYLITSLSQIAPKVRHALQGHAGPQGPQGPTGPQGSPGAQGAQGADGKQGAPGHDAGNCPPGTTLVFSNTPGPDPDMQANCV